MSGVGGIEGSRVMKN
jgi:hypothetical protein